jgi:hypothetical protein
MKTCLDWKQNRAVWASVTRKFSCSIAILLAFLSPLSIYHNGFVFYLIHFILGRMTEQWLGKRLEWSGHGLFMTFPAWRAWGKLYDTSVTIVCVSFEIRTGQLQNTRRTLPLLPALLFSSFFITSPTSSKHNGCHQASQLSLANSGIFINHFTLWVSGVTDLYITTNTRPIIWAYGLYPAAVITEVP